MCVCVIAYVPCRALAGASYPGKPGITECAHWADLVYSLALVSSLPRLEFYQVSSAGGEQSYAYALFFYCSQAAYEVFCFILLFFTELQQHPKDANKTPVNGTGQL